MTDYEKIIQKTIDKEKEVLGETAIEHAKSIEQLTVDEEGKIEEIGGEGEEILEELVNKYTSIGGKAAATLIARELKQLDLSGVKLPTQLETRL